jgi:hypothetical protein
MPKACERNGRVRTVHPDPKHYFHVCYLGSKSYRGPMHTMKTKSRSRTRPHVH